MQVNDVKNLQQMPQRGTIDGQQQWRNQQHRRYAYVFVFLLLLVPEVSHASPLHWVLGQTGLTSSLSIGQQTVPQAETEPHGTHKWNPGHYLKFSAKNGDSEDSIVRIIQNFQNDTTISGYMIVIFWRDVEESYKRGRFEIIDTFLEHLGTHQSIFVLLLDRDADMPCARQRAIPADSQIELIVSEGSNGNICYPAVWSATYEQELSDLIARLGDVYDTDLRFQGLILPETASGRGHYGNTAEGKDAVKQVLINVAEVAGEHFPHTHFIQGMNWLGSGCPTRATGREIPECEDSAFNLLREIVDTHRTTAGGGIYAPDIVPWRLVPEVGFARIPSYDIYRENSANSLSVANDIVNVVGNDTSQLGEFGLNRPAQLIEDVYAMATTGYTNDRDEFAEGFSANYIVWNGQIDAWTKEGKIEGYRDAVLAFLASSPPVNTLCPTNIVENGGCITIEETLHHKIYLPIASR